MKPGRWTYSQFLLNCLWRDWCWLWQFIHQTELCLAVSISLVMTTQNSSCCWGWSPSLMKISIFSQRDVGTISQWCLPVGSLFHSSTAFVLYKSDFIFDCRVKFHSPWLMQGCSYQLCLFPGLCCSRSRSENPKGGGSGTLSVALQETDGFQDF